MQLNVNNHAVTDGLMQHVHRTVLPAHNFVAVQMQNISRRVWVDLLGGLRASAQFTPVGQQSGCTYGLEDGTFARRSGDKLTVFTSTDARSVPFRLACVERKGVFTDTPTRARQRFATVTHLASEQQRP